jgi:hypothetical protein
MVRWWPTRAIQFTTSGLGAIPVTAFTPGGRLPSSLGRHVGIALDRSILNGKTACMAKEVTTVEELVWMIEPRDAYLSEPQRRHLLLQAEQHRYGT